jgi:hypothetical protein
MAPTKRPSSFKTGYIHGPEAREPLQCERHSGSRIPMIKLSVVIECQGNELAVRVLHAVMAMTQKPADLISASGKSASVKIDYINVRVKPLGYVNYNIDDPHTANMQALGIEILQIAFNFIADTICSVVILPLQLCYLLLLISLLECLVLHCDFLADLVTVHKN